MAQTIYYTLSRDSPLEPAELEQLAQHVGRFAKLKGYELRVAPSPGRTGVIAFGWVKTGYSVAKMEKVLAAVTELRGIVPGSHKRKG